MAPNGGKWRSGVQLYLCRWDLHLIDDVWCCATRTRQPKWKDYRGRKPLIYTLRHVAALLRVEDRNIADETSEDRTDLMQMNVNIVDEVKGGS